MRNFDNSKKLQNTEINEMIKSTQRFLVLFAAALFFTQQLGIAAVSAKTKTSTGFASGLQDAISDFQTRLPSVFKELSPEDVGNKPHIKTHFVATQSFTSDSDLGREQDTPAYLARLSPGITLQAPIGDRLYTELDYTYSFASASGRRTRSHTNSHQITAAANYEVSDNTGLGLKNSTQWSQVPGSNTEMFFLQSSDVGLTHKFSSILDGYVSDRFQWYRDRAQALSQEFVDNGVSGGASYRVSDRITLTPNNTWNIRHFSEIGSKDYWQYNYGLGAAYKLGSRTTLAAHAGHNIRQFNEGSDRTDHALFWGGGITNSINKKTVWHLDYMKAVQDTFDTSFVDRNTPTATNVDNLDNNFRVVDTHRISTGINYNINEKNSLAFEGVVMFTQTDAEDNVLRQRENDEKVMEIGPSYSYRLNKYISFEIGYTFGKRLTSEDSGAGRGTYTFHKATAGLAVNI